MIKPTEYKSISIVDARSRQGSPISDEKKERAFTILSKLMDLIKVKHS